MPPRPALRPRPVTELYAEIGFDPALEALGFRLLAELDLDGSRAAFGRLVDQLEPLRDGDGGRTAASLLEDVLQRVNRRLHRPPHDDPEFHATRILILREFAAAAGADEARRTFARRLNALISSVHAFRASVHPVVQKAQAFIEEHYRSRIALAGIARSLHVSPSYLSRLFRKETGTTLTEQIHRVRLEHARLLLASGGRSLSEIAFLVGYQTYRDFYRNFVKYESASPRQARRRIGAARDERAPFPGDTRR